MSDFLGLGDELRRIQRLANLNNSRGGIFGDYYRRAAEREFIKQAGRTMHRSGCNGSGDQDEESCDCWDEEKYRD